MILPKVALTMIVKGSDDEAPLLANCLAAIAGQVDGIFIGVNTPKGVKPSKKVLEVAKQYADDVYTFDWTGNYVEARNYSFKQVPEDYDWIIWLDADDRVENPHKIREVLSITPKHINGMYVRYDYQHDEYGNVTVYHDVCRVVRNNNSFAWKSSIDDTEVSVHETLVERYATQSLKTTDFKVVHQDSRERTIASLERNIELLQGMYKRQNEKGNVDPRILFYLATHYYDAFAFNETKNLLTEYLQLSGWDEERSEAHIFLGRIMLMENRMPQARMAFLMALAENNLNKQAPIELARIEYKAERYLQAARWLLIAEALPEATTTMVQKPMDVTYELKLLETKCHIELGAYKWDDGQMSLEKATESITAALKLRPADEEALELQELIYKLINYQNDAKAAYRMTRYYKGIERVEEIVPFLGTLGSELQEHMTLQSIYQEYTEPEVWPYKSIAIYAGHGPLGIWGPWSLDDGGIGGSEEAIIRLSRELTALGWKVVVYASPGARKGVYDGVEWRHYWELNARDEFDVFVSWRQPWIFDAELNARKKYLWLHDVMPTEDFTPQRLDHIDKVIFLSDFHYSLFKDVVPEEKAFISSNGINPNDFGQLRQSRIKHRMIYMSSHERGLQILYEIWPEIKAAVPDATLDVYYGWQSFDAINRDNPAQMLWKGRMITTENELDGVTNHGRIDQKQIVKEIETADIFAYPCAFPEVYCITLIKAMAGGAYPVTSDYGALGDFNTFGDKTHFDLPPTKEQIESYKNMLIKHLKDGISDETRTKLIDTTRRIYDWVLTADGWVEEMA